MPENTTPQTESTPSAQSTQSTATTQPTQDSQNKTATLEGRLEQVIAAEREAKRQGDEAAKTLKQAQDLQTSLAHLQAINESASKGERMAAVRALLKEGFDETFLLEVATALSEDKEELTTEEIVSRELERRQKETEATQTKAQQEEQQREYNSFVSQAKAALDAGKDDRFDLCDKHGVDMDRFNEVMIGLIDKDGKAPSPEQILDVIEAELEAKVSKSKKFARVQQQAQPTNGTRPSTTQQPGAQPIVPRGVQTTDLDHIKDPVERRREMNRRAVQAQRDAGAMGARR